MRHCLLDPLRSDLCHVSFKKSACMGKKGGVCALEVRPEPLRRSALESALQIHKCVTAALGRPASVL